MCRIEIMPSYWLIKTEPHTWSWSQQVYAGNEGTEWDGVRNHQAKNNIKNMKVGDLVFFYHSGSERQIIGIVTVLTPPKIDSTDLSNTWYSTYVSAVSTLHRPVTLSEIKQNSCLSNMLLVTNSRLSVQPVTMQEWQEILRISSTTTP